MTKLNTDNFIKSENESEKFVFISEAVFAMNHLKNGDHIQAKRAGGNAYHFALDNMHLDMAVFSTLAVELLSGIP